MTAFAIEILLKSSLLIASAATLDLGLRRRGSAATRHLVWTLTVVALALLPPFLLTMPRWDVRVPIAQQRFDPGRAPQTPIDRLGISVGRTIAADAPRGNANAVAAVGAVGVDVAAKTLPVDDPTGGSTSGLWLVSGIAIYVVGAGALLVRLLRQLLSVRKLRRLGLELRDEEWTRELAECASRMGVRRPVRLLSSRDQTIPMAVGIRSAAVVLPLAAATWAVDRRRAVLLHELAHVARLDCVTQLFAGLTCALYWFHPGVWWAARRMRDEREIACDDRVVSSGTHATDYADHLLELAYSSVGGRAPALAVTMARPNDIEARLRALLDAARNRTAPALRTRLTIGAVAIAVLALLAAARATFVPVGAQAAAVPAAGVTSPADLVASQPRSRETRVDAAAQAIADGQPGTWEVRSSGNGIVDVRLSERRGSSHSFSTVAVNVTGAGFSLASGSTVVKWTLQQDAGAFLLEGIARPGDRPNAFVGAGTFTFEPSPSFPAALATRGFGRPTRVEQYLLARSDVGFAFIDELSRQGYARPDLTDLVRAADHGVSLSHVREMNQLGYRLGRIDALVTQVDHGVSPAFVRGLRDSGLTKLSADDLVRARDHGVDPDYINALKAFGYAPLTLDALVRARDHGIDPDYVRNLRQQGYRLTLDELIMARDHGVDDAYVTTMAGLGYAKLSLEDLVGARDHGVDADYIGALRSLGYQVPLPDLIAARDHGVDSQYARELVTLGYKGLPLEQLIRLRDHGVDPNYIRELQMMGYTNQTPDDLVRLRDSGVSRNRLKVELRYRLDRVLAMVNRWVSML
jgi:beta-lactamase regulating signal transducer with metallopeptidase domain